jgi:hypothetical protein
MNGPEFLIPITFFLTIGAVFISRSRIGEAIADRIRGGDPLAVTEVRLELDQLRQDLDTVRHELAETQERLDFAERLLAKGPDAARIPGSA